jgi:hypothetical protein
VSTPTVEGLSAIGGCTTTATSGNITSRVRAAARCRCSSGPAWSTRTPPARIGPRQVHYRCAHCAGRIEERDKPAMLAAGEWKARARAPQPRLPDQRALLAVGALERARREWIKANAERDKRGLQEFVNLRLGEVWTEESARITVEALEKNREPYEASRSRRRAAASLRRRRRAGQPPRGSRWSAGVPGARAGGSSTRSSPATRRSTATWHRLDTFCCAPGRATTGARCRSGAAASTRAVTARRGLQVRADAPARGTSSRPRVTPARGAAGGQGVDVEPAPRAALPDRRRHRQGDGLLPSGARWRRARLLPLPDRPRLRRRVLQGPDLGEARHQGAQRTAHDRVAAGARAQRAARHPRAGDGCDGVAHARLQHAGRRRGEGARAAPTQGSPVLVRRRRVLSRGIE